MPADLNAGDLFDAKVHGGHHFRRHRKRRGDRAAKLLRHGAAFADRILASNRPDLSKQKADQKAGQ